MTQGLGSAVAAAERGSAPSGVREDRETLPLRRLDVGAGHALWSLSPYAPASTTAAVEAGRGASARPQALGALQTLLQEGRPGTRRLVLGLEGEAWQPVEERCRLTRRLLELMVATPGGVDLQVHTRASLIARDADLLRQLSRTGRVTVAFQLGSLDERVNRWLEPGAPSALRRMMAMQALAHTGVVVGLRLSSVLPSLDAEQLETLLTRAAHAGARFVELGTVGLSRAEIAAIRAREQAGESRPRALRRLTFRAGEAEALRATLVDLCLKLGMVPLDGATPELAEPASTPAHHAPALQPVRRVPAASAAPRTLRAAPSRLAAHTGALRERPSQLSLFAA